MKKVCVLSYFGLGDCIRFSPIFKKLEEEIGPCHFDFTSSPEPLQNVFDVGFIQVLPMNFHKHYDVVLNFTDIRPETTKDECIWRGIIGPKNRFTGTHHDPGNTYVEFMNQFAQLQKTGGKSNPEIVPLCKKYSKLIDGPTSKIFAAMMGINPSSWKYLYKVVDEECFSVVPFLSDEKKNICFAPLASVSIRSLNEKIVRSIYELIKHHNVIYLNQSDPFNLPCTHACGTLRNVSAIVDMADAVITVDSYFSHLAFALGKPAVVLYSYGSNFTKPLDIEAPFFSLEHPTEDCNHIQLNYIQSAIEAIL